ncbi:hypothetical protein QTP70_002535 [Hemibagrus guttatus]|uniref:Uncharacterized protein n=1 Tax=Hemibagrus guttatus TaxID=175788 RepID=A0AAE0V8F9_9TELE|nr:hypothetical protein QTP70_002535 [Hemibagrus guttatus]
MGQSGNAQRQVEEAVKYLYDSHSEFLKQSQAESGEKEEDRRQLYQEVKKMQKELDGRLNKTTDELKAVRERIKEKEQQRAKKSVVISTMITRSKKQRPEEEDGEEEVKDGLPEYNEGRSEQAQGAAAQFPVMIKGNDVAYVPWSFLDLTGLIGRLPSICEGAQKWITRFEEQTMGQMLALGDIKAILSQSLGKAKMIEIFQNVNLKKEAEGQIYDPRSFGPHRNSIWHSLRDAYPTRADPGRVEKIKREEDESVAEFVLRLQKAWREEMGGAWDETAASQTLFRMMVKKALPMEVQDQLDTVVGLSTMAWPTFEANIVHYVELHRRKEREAKKAADSLVMQLHKAQLSELARNKQDIMEKKKEKKKCSKASSSAGSTTSGSACGSACTSDSTASGHDTSHSTTANATSVLCFSTTDDVPPSATAPAPVSKMGSGTRTESGISTTHERKSSNDSRKERVLGVSQPKSPTARVPVCLSTRGANSAHKRQLSAEPRMAGTRSWTGPWMGPNQQSQRPMNSGMGPMGPTPGSM